MANDNGACINVQFCLFLCCFRNSARQRAPWNLNESIFNPEIFTTFFCTGSLGGLSWGTTVSISCSIKQNKSSEFPPASRWLLRFRAPRTRWCARIWAFVSFKRVEKRDRGRRVSPEGDTKCMMTWSLWREVLSLETSLRPHRLSLQLHNWLFLYICPLSARSWLFSI